MRTDRPGTSQGCFEPDAERAIFLALFWGRGHGIILLEHLFLGLALVDARAVGEIQLPVQSRTLPVGNAWRRKPLVSEAFHQVVFGTASRCSPAPVTLAELADALRGFCESGDAQLNLQPRVLTGRERERLARQVHLFPLTSE